MSEKKTYLALSLLLIVSAVGCVQPVFADSFTIFGQPNDGNYKPSTTNYGGGDGSGGTIGSLGPFKFDIGLVELSVPSTWSTWNSPPFTESNTPNVLWTNGVTFLQLSLPKQQQFNTAGFELQPDLYASETIQAAFYNQSGGLIGTITRDVNGYAGALLFALQDDSPGQSIGYILVTDEAGDDFAIAELRAGNSPAELPEPGTLTVLIPGLLGAGCGLRRKLFAA